MKYHTPQPLVSVCVPMYNAEEWVEETLTRLLQQTYPNIEIIIVDDHSTDKSLAIAEQFESDYVHIYSNPKKGGNPARNFAFAMSKGEYVKFMDADDYMDDDAIEKQIARLLAEDKPEESIVFSPLLFVMPEGEFVEMKGRNIDHDYIPGIDLLLDMWRGKGHNCPHCHLMHRSLVEKSGGWNESLIKNQDGEFFGRLYISATKAICVDSTRIYWRRTFCGISANQSTNAKRDVIKSYIILTNCILSYSNNIETRDLCAANIAKYIWEYCVDVKTVSSTLDEFCHTTNVTLHVPPHSKFKCLEPLIGFKNCLRLRNLSNK